MDRDRERSHRPPPSVLVAVALGGALGAPARHAISHLIGIEAGRFPWATLAVNVTGSLALGVLLALVPGRHARAFLATGFLGSYTTYSTFAVETDVLVRDGHLAVAVAYVVVSLVAGFAAVRAGNRALRRAG